MKGHLYLRGTTWWMKYYVDGRPVYESTRQTKERPAQGVLNQRLGKLAACVPVVPRLDRIGDAEVAKDLRDHYTSSDTEDAGWRLKHLDAFFEHYRVAAISPADITRYIAGRQSAEASNGSINREVAVLGRMLKLAYENGKLARLPLIRS